MVELLKELNDLGWFNVILIIALAIILIPLAIESWKKFVKSIGLKSVEEIEDEKTESTLSHLEHEVEQYKENRIHDREQSFQIQHELIDMINSVNDALNKIKSDALEDKIERMRWRILDFASQLRNRQIIGLEQFNFIFKTYDKYEKILEENGLINGQVEESIKFIREKYHEMLSQKK